MSRFSFYIDGFNVYHALNDPYEHKPNLPKIPENRIFYLRKYKWLNYYKLAESVVGPKDAVTGVFYFTTFAKWHPDSVERHEIYIKALESVGVNTVFGRFKDKKIKCHICEQFFKTHEEKQTDVNIALRVLSDAVDDLFDKAVIISADSDLLPVIELVHHQTPTKEIGIMFPIGRNNNELRQNASFTHLMSPELLEKCQFLDEINISGIIIKRPDTWQ